MQELLQDLGENYQYIRTLAVNKIELTKIEAAESVAKLLGYLLLTFLLVVFGGLTVVGLMVLLVIFLIKLVGSLSLALVAVSGFAFLITIAIFVLRERMIYQPMTKFFYSRFFKNENYVN